MAKELTICMILGKWLENGQLKERCHVIKNGMRSGLCERWYESGEKKAKETYETQLNQANELVSSF